MRVIVVGAGIGGLTVAIALHARGIECQVYESVREIAPLGVGINVLPHAMAVLRELGLMERVAALGIATSELCFFNRHGQIIWREPRGIGAGYTVAQVSLHRGRFQLELLAAAQERLGAHAIRTGVPLTAISAGDDGALPMATFTDRRSGQSFTDSGDVIIGADGIHSVVRRHFFPDEGPPHWSGNILWRGVTEGSPFLTGRSMFMAGHRPHKFVAYPITAPRTDGRLTINWIAELDRTARGLPGLDDWNKRGDFADFAPRFADWRFDWLDVPSLIAGAEAVFEFPMVDRDPLPQWRHGRVTLLGDAAHPMYPIGSNGSSQAILDARALADALDEAKAAGGGRSAVEDSLDRYEAARRPATAAIVASNRQHGPERVMDMAEARAPDGFDRIDDVFRAGELEEIAASYKRTAGFALEK